MPDTVPGVGNIRLNKRQNPCPPGSYSNGAGKAGNKEINSMSEGSHSEKQSKEWGKSLGRRQTKIWHLPKANNRKSNNTGERKAKNRNTESIGQEMQISSKPEKSMVYPLTQYHGIVCPSGWQYTEFHGVGKWVAFCPFRGSVNQYDYFVYRAIWQELSQCWKLRPFDATTSPPHITLERERLVQRFPMQHCLHWGKAEYRFL